MSANKGSFSITVDALYKILETLKRCYPGIKTGVNSLGEPSKPIAWPTWEEDILAFSRRNLDITITVDRVDEVTGITERGIFLGGKSMFVELCPDGTGKPE